MTAAIIVRSNRRIYLRAGLAIAVAALILLIPALLNGFPFLFQDSADYLILTPRLYRSPFYGLFIFFFHMNRFVWAPVIAQALITSHLLYVMVKIHVRAQAETLFPILIVLLAAFSSLPFFVGFVMPDIFTSLMFILMYLIGFSFFSFSLTMRLYLLALACVAVSSHLSHLVMAVAIVWLFVPLLRWCGRSWKNVRDHMAALSLPIVLTVLAYLLFNTVVFHSLSLSPAGQTFFLANLIEGGPARSYLKQACPQAGYKICVLANRLPETANDFLWKEGNLFALGGFQGMATESGSIVAAILKQHPLGVARMAADNFASGLERHEPAKELAPRYFPSWTSIFDLLALKFGPAALAQFRASAEMRDAIPHVLIRAVDNVVVPVAFFALIGLGFYAASRGERRAASLAILMLCAVLGNALLCAAVSGVYDRYQARMTWLLPMAVFILVSTLIFDRKRRENAAP